MKKWIPLLLAGLFIGFGCGGQTATSDEEVAVIKTDFGDIVIAFYEDDAPEHVKNFKKLALEGFYNGCTFHRIIPGFMIQGGDPNSKNDDRADDGQGGPGYTIPAEIKMNHKQGALAAARMGDNVNPERESSGSQFYICVVKTSHLDGAYTVFGETIDGFDVIDEIVAQPRDARNNPNERIEMAVEIVKRSKVMEMD